MNSLTGYLTNILIQRTPQKPLNMNIPVSIVETLARLVIYDPDNFVKYLNRIKIKITNFLY